VDLADAAIMVKRQRRRSHLCTAIALVALASPAIRAADDGVVLRPRYQAGDRYALTLVTRTNTKVDARGGARNAFREDVELRYAAQVEVLETDAAGAPLRERHENVDFTSVRPDDTKSLFAPGATFELARRTDGSVQIQFKGERVAAKIEQIVGDLLAHQSEYSIAALLDPGHPVAVGERWDLDPERVQSFLQARGIRSVKLDGAASAQLEAGEGGQFALRYRIPIEKFVLPDLPAGTTRTESEGSLKGEVQLGAQGLHRAVAHRSSLELEIDGAVHQPGTARATAWSLARTQSVDQHTETLRDQLATSR
jgi:hypothetical protein